MSLTFKTGDMFREPAEAIVNTVNCVGVMGKGVALEFKKRWPENFKAYRRLCESRQLRPGKVYVHQAGDILDGSPRFLINFPTKDHWRAKSKMEFIETGLEDFVTQVRRLRIRSVVMPPLGCGNGGLDWTEVKALLTARLSPVEDVNFVIFTPGGEPGDATEIKMTFERAVLLKALHELSPHFDGRLTRITMQKITYFLQEIGVAFGLKFNGDEFSPYSPELRNAFESMERQGLLQGFTSGDRGTCVTKAGVRISDDHLRDGGLEAAEELVGRVSRLVEGYESPYGLELLSLVHFLATRVEGRSVDGVMEALGRRDYRERTKFDPLVVGIAFERLTEDRLVHA